MPNRVTSREPDPYASYREPGSDESLVCEAPKGDVDHGAHDDPRAYRRMIPRRK